MEKPTPTGRKRFPPTGFALLRIPCTCHEACPDECLGECGCRACGHESVFYYENATATLYEKARRADLDTIEEELEQRALDARNRERIIEGWRSVDKNNLDPKTRLLAAILPTEITGIDPVAVRPSVVADGLLTHDGDLTSAGRALLWPTGAKTHDR